MITKFSEVLNEMAGVMTRIAVITDAQDNTNKIVYLVDRQSVRVIKEKELQMFDSKNNFTPFFKNYVNKYFQSMDNFLKNSMFVNVLEDGLLRLKKEKRFIEIDQD